MSIHNWLQWQQPWRPNGHSTEVEGRLSRLEGFQEQQEDRNEQITDRMKWLERGLQCLAAIVLIILTKQAPQNAAALADILTAIIKR